jgi:hypothetical protein
MFLPAFRQSRRAETNNARTFTGTGIVAACHKVERRFNALAQGIFWWLQNSR